MRPQQLRRSIVAVTILAPALIIGCAATSAATQSPSSAPQAGSRWLIGDWMGGRSEDGRLATTWILHVSADADGGLHGVMDDSKDPEKDDALTNITADASTWSAAGEGFTVDGTVSADGKEFHGTYKVTDTVGRLFAKLFGEKPETPFVMHRADAAAFPLRRQDHSYTVDGRSIHYEEVAGATAARVVFIHGSPGEAEDWRSYLTNTGLQHRATLIAVDRPGFGESGAGQVVTDLHQQARLLEPALRQAAGEAGKPVPTIVVGWSEGGPIAAEMAMDYPDEIQAAILEAPAIDPEHDGAQWYNRAADFWPIGKLVSWVMGDGFMWANHEMMPLGTELKAMEPRWKSLKVPVVVVQGMADSLVDPRTADFAERVLPAGSRVVRVPGVDHDVPFTKAALDVLNQELDRVAGSAAQMSAAAGS
jgi:pimeloyl-ACP methyl ester carboxylesterase